MTRTTYVYRDGKVLPIDEAEPLPHRKPNFGVITDTMDAVKHPCNGLYCDSKSAFRAITKAHGCVEVGNERLAPRKRTNREPIAETIRRARNKHGLL